MPTEFKIINHNKYNPPDEEYDEYSMLLLEKKYYGSTDKSRWGYINRKYILDVLRNDICEDIELFIKIVIPPILFTSRIKYGILPEFGLFVFEPELSTLIKLTYN